MYERGNPWLHNIDCTFRAAHFAKEPFDVRGPVHPIIVDWITVGNKFSCSVPVAQREGRVTLNVRCLSHGEELFAGKFFYILCHVLLVYRSEVKGQGVGVLTTRYTQGAEVTFIGTVYLYFTIV